MEHSQTDNDTFATASQFTYPTQEEEKEESQALLTATEEMAEKQELLKNPSADSSMNIEEAKDEDGPEETPVEPDPIQTLCKSTCTELTNLGKALACPICCSTYTNPVILPCVHAYCRSCIVQAFHNKPECPTCKAPATKRGLVECPVLEQMGVAYKQVMRALGWSPSVFASDVCMTQLPSAADLVDCHDQLQASKTWQRAMDGEENDILREERRKVVEVNQTAIVQAAVKKRRRSRERGVEVDLESEKVTAKPTERREAGKAVSFQQKCEMTDAKETARKEPCMLPAATPAVSESSPKAGTKTTETSDDGVATATEEEVSHLQKEKEPCDANPREKVDDDDTTMGDEEPEDLAFPSNDEEEDNVAEDAEAEKMLSTESRREEQVPESKTKDAIEPNNEWNAGSRVIRCAVTNDDESKSKFPTGEEPKDKSVARPRVNSCEMEDDDESTSRWQTDDEPNDEPVTRSPVSGFEMASDFEITPRLQTDEEPSNRPPVSEIATTPTHDHIALPHAVAAQSPVATIRTHSNSSFVVGTVVKVHARTWPGINKPGGVARISKVHSDPTLSYDVNYVLGGREKRVAPAFLVLNDPLSEAATPQRAGRGVREEIPVSILQALEVQGFGNLGRKRKAGPTSSTTATVNEKENKQAMQLKLKKAARKVTNKRQIQTQRKAAGKRKATEDPNESVKKNRKQAKTARAANLTLAKSPLPDLSNERKFDLADARYQKLIEREIQAGVVQVVTTSLPERDQATLNQLARDTKKQDVKVKLSETFNPKRTTLAIMPLDSVADKAQGLARVRTLKAMRASLAGIPIVTPEWIRHCCTSGKVVPPTSSMFVRSLPTKTQELAESSSLYGASLLAARLEQAETGDIPKEAAKPLKNVCVTLCGTFVRPPKGDLNCLLRESGATISATSASAIKVLEGNSFERCAKKMVIVCDDTTSNDVCGITVAQASQIERAIRKYQGRVLLVNSNWLFDVIACGQLVPGSHYKPKSDRCSDLWSLSYKI